MTTSSVGADGGSVTGSAAVASAGAIARRGDLGLLAVIVSSAAFGCSGPFAKSLLETGWSSGAAVLIRIGIAALVLLVPALVAARGRWRVVRRSAGQIVAFGLIAVAACQVCYFFAVSRLPVAVALLLEYLGIVLVVLWMWLRTRRAPSGFTLIGIGLAIAGLALVLDVFAGFTLDGLGVFVGLGAAVGLAVYYVVCAHVPAELPAVVLAGLGMGIGAVALGILGAAGVIPLHAGTDAVTLRGTTFPWWVSVLVLAFVAAAAAYLIGAIGVRRVGSTVASFVGLTEVLFAVLFAWLLLDELPGPVQAVGGASILLGVVAVRAGEARAARVGITLSRAPTRIAADSVSAATTDR